LFVVIVVLLLYVTVFRYIADAHGVKRGYDCRLRLSACLSAQ